MKQKIYDCILEVLSRTYSFDEGLSELNKQYPEIAITVSTKTVKSIQSQYYVRRMRRSHQYHYSRDTREKYYRLYKKAVSDGVEHAIMNLASKNDISPCLLARIILEEYYWTDVDHKGQRSDKKSLPPGFMTDCIRDVAKLPNPRLAMEIYETNILDNFYGPAVDSIKRCCGVEYEVILQSFCKKAGMLYMDEDQMRDEGYDKTPDIKLKLPVLINKRVVNWIESKASFGDPICHQQYMIDQYLPYKNRFGPGLVIYWFGFVDELSENCERDIMILDAFPKPEEIALLSEAQAEADKNKVSETKLRERTVLNEDDMVKYYDYVDPMFDTD